MTRLTKLLIGGTLVAVMVLGAATAAFAAPMLTLSATRTTVTYPQPTWLKVVASDGDAALATTVTIQYRPIGTDTWKKLRSISASRTGEGTVTVPVSPYMLKSITGFRAIAEGLESEVTTVQVKARLSAAIKRQVAYHGHTIRVKGFIWPRHAVDTTPVVVTLWKWEAGAWVEKAELTPKIVAQTPYGSKWSFKLPLTESDKGKWRFQVSHEDMKHVFSTSRYSYLRVK